MEYYPSAALFQKPTAEIDQESAARFTQPAQEHRPARLGEARLLPEGIGFAFQPNARIPDPLRPGQRQ